MHEILSSTFAHCDISKRIDFINLPTAIPISKGHNYSSIE